MTEKLINSPEDFPRVAIYERAGAGGPIYRVTFYNKEFVRGWSAVPRGLFGLAAGLAFVPVMAFLTVTAENMGVSWVSGAAAGLLLYGILFANLWRPAKSLRVIELDKGADKLRVLRSGRLELERQLSRMANLTVDAHPEAEYKRAVRLEKGNQTLSDEEKSHCLIGWFGAGGAEKVVLITRAEWPCHHSLFEVRQAVLWARERAGRKGERDSPYKPAGGGEREKHEGGGGMNPPLD